MSYALLRDEMTFNTTSRSISCKTSFVQEFNNMTEAEDYMSRNGFAIRDTFGRVSCQTSNVRVTYRLCKLGEVGIYERR